MGQETKVEVSRVEGGKTAVPPSVLALEAHWQSGAHAEARYSAKCVRGMAASLGAQRFAVAAADVRDRLRGGHDFDPAPVALLRRHAERAVRALSVALGIGVHR